MNANTINVLWKELEAGPLKDFPDMDFLKMVFYASISNYIEMQQRVLSQQVPEMAQAQLTYWIRELNEFEKTTGEKQCTLP